MNPAITISRFHTREALVEAAARSWLESIARHSHPVFSVALPGGRVAASLFAAFARQAKQAAADLRRVRFLWGDERCVPPDHPESNFAIAREHLLAELQIPAEQVHRIRGEVPAPEAAHCATDELQALGIRLSPSGFPVLDLVLVGMGEDGHIASLFPGEDESSINDPALFRPVRAVKPPPWRVTMGYGLLLSAIEFWVLASGPGKNHALQESLQTTATPLGRVLALRRQSRVLVDFPLVAEHQVHTAPPQLSITVEQPHHSK